MNWIETLVTAFGSLIRCRHWQTPVVEGKAHCPDCGAGVLFRWTVLRCSDCGMRRGAAYRFRQVVPEHRCCVGCGAEAVTYEYLYNPEYFQLRHALLSIQPDPCAESGSIIQSCRAWFAESFTATVAWAEEPVRPAGYLASSRA